MSHLRTDTLRRARLFERAETLKARLAGAVKNPDALNTQEQARLLQAAHAMSADAGPVRGGGGRVPVRLNLAQ